jgi:hypothetical protein
VTVSKKLASSSRYLKPSFCRFQRDVQDRHGLLILAKVTAGSHWWTLDDAIRTAATGAQPDDRVPDDQLWTWVNLWHLTPASCLPAMEAALQAEGAEPARLEVVVLPDASACTHPSCVQRPAKPSVYLAG